MADFRVYEEERGYYMSHKQKVLKNAMYIAKQTGLSRKFNS